MSHASDLIDELVKAQLKPALKELGFRSKSSTFFRQNGEAVEVIASQKSKWNDAMESKFTINLGVYWPNAQALLGRVSKTSPPKEYECTLRQRLGALYNGGNDHWWSVTPQSDIAQIGADVMEKIQSFALPWLRRASSMHEAVKMAQTNQAIVFHVLMGERVKAAELIEEAINKTTHAKAFLRSLAAKLGLEISGQIQSN